jgi:hypothetical protein
MTKLMLAWEKSDRASKLSIVGVAALLCQRGYANEVGNRHSRIHHCDLGYMSAILK